MQNLQNLSINVLIVTKNKHEKHLKAHIKFAHERKMFSCKECEKSYTDKSGLSDHKKSHHTKVLCTVCELNKKKYIFLSYKR